MAEAAAHQVHIKALGVGPQPAAEMAEHKGKLLTEHLRQ